MPGLVEPGTLVLIIDDDAVVRDAMVDALTMEGYAAQPASCAEAALALLAAGARPALVIVDLWLPGLGSAGFVRQLRASDDAHIPVLAISGAGPLEQMEIDADALLRKPSDLTTLVRAVDKLIAVRGSTARHPSR